jgi:hypothetical protein
VVIKVAITEVTPVAGAFQADFHRLAIADLLPALHENKGMPYQVLGDGKREAVDYED